MCGLTKEDKRVLDELKVIYNEKTYSRVTQILIRLEIFKQENTHKKEIDYDNI